MPLTPPARHWLPRFALFAGFALATGLAAQTPPGKKDDKAAPPPAPGKLGGFDDEEMEPKPPTVKKKLAVEDEGPPPVTVPKGAFYVRSEDLYRASNEAKHPAIRDAFARYTVAFDRITDTSDRPIRVLPIPIRWPEEKFPQRFGIFELTPENTPRLLRGMDLGVVKKIDHFEDLVLADAALLTDLTQGLRENPYVSAEAPDRLAAAERLLAAAVGFHDGARDQNRRKGKAWEPTKIKLADRLAGVRVQRIKFAAEQKDWATVRSLGGRMLTLYPNNLKLLQDVYGARLAEGEAVLAASNTPSELERVRDMLSDFESKFPGADSPAAARVKEAMAGKAKKLFAQAEAAVRSESPEARNLVRLVELLDPDFPGLRELQGHMKSGYTVLYVAVNHLPERMSPATARLDSEKMAVELLYEGLLDPLPDETHGTRYRPALAAAMPAPGALVRDVPLTVPAEWTGAAKGPFDAADVAGTLKLLRQTRHTWAAFGIDWIDDRTRVEDLRKVRVAFQTGHPHPLSLLTFKLLPSRYLVAQNKAADDVEFALRPCGTGPFRFQERKAGEVVFTANPTYGRRPGRLGQPYIKEVRFVTASAVQNPVAEFKGEKLHVLTDVPTADLTKFTAPTAGLQGRVNVVTAANNRRIHILAVNHRKPVLQSAALRRGIGHAIDREAILKDVYRANFDDFHKALAGPFPPGSWATPKPLGAAPRPLYDPNLAQGKLAEHFRKLGSASLGLAYPADDPRAKLACERIKKQVEAVGTGEDGKVAINLEPIPTPELYRRVFEEAGFDLAFVPFDYPNDLYPLGLGGLLDPTAAVRGGRNYMGCLVKQNNPSPEDETLGRLLGEAKAHADPARLAQKGHEIFTRFNDAMPFVPLWQLDRHTVLATSVKVAFDDRAEPAQPRLLPPVTLFSGVARWRIE